MRGEGGEKRKYLATGAVVALLLSCFHGVALAFPMDCDERVALCTEVA